MIDISGVVRKIKISPMNKNTLLIVKTKVKKLIKQKYNYLYSQTMIMHVCIPWQKVVIIEIDCLIKNPKALNKRAQSLPDTDEFVQNHWDEREREESFHRLINTLAPSALQQFIHIRKVMSFAFVTKIDVNIYDL